MEISVQDLLETILDISPSAKISILQDVARGLVNLHDLSPPMIHRDLTARQILLNSGMVAKISVSISSGVMHRDDLTMTCIPGTLLYMPPEAWNTPSMYSLSLDMFSFGHLTLFMATQEFPCDLLPPVYDDPRHPGQIKARTELERRRKYFEKLEITLGGKDPVLLLAKECLHNMPEKRPSAYQALQKLGSIDAVIQDPFGHDGRLHIWESLLGMRRGNKLEATLFAELKPYTRNVQVTGKQLGHGAHGSVVEVKVGEKILAAKSFREISLTNIQSFVHTFCARMILLLKLSHPNILKYEGICYLSSD